MNLTIHIPDTLQDSLERQFGTNLSRAAAEALAVAWYQAEKISIGQAAELLGISVYEADGLMKQHQAGARLSEEEFERDRENLRRVLKS